MGSQSARTLVVQDALLGFISFFSHPYAVEIFFGEESQGTGERALAVVAGMGLMARGVTWMATKDCVQMRVA